MKRPLALPAWVTPAASFDEKHTVDIVDNHSILRDEVEVLQAKLQIPDLENGVHVKSSDPSQVSKSALSAPLHSAPSNSGPSKSDPPIDILNPFNIDLEELVELNAERNIDALKANGGIDGLADLLHSDLDKGIDIQNTRAPSMEIRQVIFGRNELPPAERASFFGILYGNLKDPILILLMAAAAVSTALGAGLPEQRARSEWIEGVAIWAAVFIVSGVGAANDYQKDKQFQKLNEQRDRIDIKAIRGGQQILVSNKDVVVGDIILLDAGDKVVADCLAYECQGLIIDEASLTGESDGIKKNGETDPWVRSGTQVAEGSAKALVVAVGPNSEWGRTMALMEGAGDDQTPLQEKLEAVATTVGKFGFGVALACFIALMIGWMVRNNGFPIKKINDNGPVQFFLYAITIIVVAIPEGLPLAVTISLAYSMKKMLMDQNFVRVLSACETMGGATAICSDKTGTLTENRMTVVEGWWAGRMLASVPAPGDLNEEVLEVLKINMAVNSKAFLLEKQESTGPGPNTSNASRVGFVGSSTECAMLMLLKTWGFDYKKIRQEHAKHMKKLHGFTSARKMSSVLIKHDTTLRLYNKGAAEWVLKRCTHVMNGEAQQEMTEEIMEQMMSIVTVMAKRGLRCICLTYTDFEADDFERPFDFFDEPDNCNQNLTALAIVGIKDPVRPEVPEAVHICQRAGITVRMVTGDNIYTAMHIAKDCGILRGDDGLSMEGPEFRKLHSENLQDLLGLLPRLRVLARSSPEDKLTLVKLLKTQGDVVAVTGDGTNDAPALKESNVGLAMGIAGTEVAKEAADIIILDDNFSSIVKSVLWGRSVFNNIRKFLQFQLTVNCSALIICFVGAVAGGVEPLNVLQLLWVNLIMDTMGALALATEIPNPELLNQMPNGPSEPLINGKMWKHIIIQGLYQVLILLLCLFVLPITLSPYKPIDQGLFFAENCIDLASSKLGIDAGSGAYNAGIPDARWYCGVMNSCGFPNHRETANTNACPLDALWTPLTVPVDEVDAVCLNTGNRTGTPCRLSNDFATARTYVQSKLDDENADIFERVLSLLFNAFIWCQIFNEICSRRINDEYDFFSGLHQSPVFMAVIGVTIGLQAIIVQLLGMFFKVVPLGWEEWLCCIGLGFGSCIVSWATRFISRNIGFDVAKAIISARKHRGATRTLSGRHIGSRSHTARPGSFAKHIGGMSMRHPPGGGSIIAINRGSNVTNKVTPVSM